VHNWKEAVRSLDFKEGPNNVLKAWGQLTGEREKLPRSGRKEFSSNESETLRKMERGLSEGIRGS